MGIRIVMHGGKAVLKNVKANSYEGLRHRIGHQQMLSRLRKGASDPQDFWGATYEHRAFKKRRKKGSTFQSRKRDRIRAAKYKDPDYTLGHQRAELLYQLNRKQDREFWKVLTKDRP